MNRRRASMLLLIGVCWVTVLGAESRFAGEWTKERGELASCTDLTKLVGCVETLFTGDPFHIAAGSLAPGNGFGAGLSVLDHWSSKKNWRNNWSVDAVGSPNGSWR